jgi:hypothetical protein
MKKALLCAVVILFSASNTRAYTDAGGRYTIGPDRYGGLSSFVEWGNDNYYLRPSMNTYASDLADRYSTYSLGGGLEGASWSAGAEVSMTPETGGYKNSAIYADLTYKLPGEPADDAFLEDLALGVFAGLTAHEDSYSVSTAAVSSGSGSGSGSGRRSTASSLASAFKLKQTDYGLTASVRACGMRLSGRFTKTVYDQDVTAEDRQLPINIGSIGASGFQDKAVGARLRFPGLPLSPEAGYAKTYYLLDQPNSEAVSAGLSQRVGSVELTAGWENFNPGGGYPKSDYYSLGLTFSF